VESAATAAVLLAYGADATATDASGQTPFDITPGASGDCEDTGSTACPKTCQLLKNGITPEQKKEIFAGKLIPDFGPQRAPGAWLPMATFGDDPPQKCCPAEENPVDKNRFSQCCL
jgi:hypothetical protein